MKELKFNIKVRNLKIQMKLNLFLTLFMVHSFQQQLFSIFTFQKYLSK